jgi:acetylornithine aminotransferase
MPTYATPTLTVARGKGVHLWDTDGRRYLDLAGGIAVSALGHAHPAVVAAVTEQIGRLAHVSNLYASEPVVQLAELLLALAGRPGRAYFGNSGAEAVEAALKISRRTGRSRIVAAVDGFHGRTMGALSLTGQPAKREPFAPLLAGVTHVPFGDAAALAAAVTDETAMVILEPIQGEAGVVVPRAGYLRAVKDITARCGALLAVDEIQTGIGRTGHWYRYQAEAGLDPDIVLLAKGLGGGLPIGACLAFGPAATLLSAGTHGSTFGGNPVACAAALAVLRTIASEGLLDNVSRIGRRLRTGVEALGHPLVAEVRGAGLLIGIALTEPVAASIADGLQAAGFLVNPVRPDVIRLAPPLILATDDADSFAAALAAVLDRLPVPEPA